MARTPRTTEQDNFHRLVMDIAWFGLGLAATTRFLSVYAIRLGAGETELGWLASLPAVMLGISTVFAGWWLKRYPDSVRALYWPALFFRLMFFLPAFAPFFPESWRLTWLILSSAIPALAQGIAGAAFIVMMREAIDQSHLTALLSKRSLALNVAIGIGAIGFGAWLEVAPFPVNYQVMFLVAFIFVLLSQAQLVWVRVNPTPRPAPAARNSLFAPWRSTSFRRVGLAVALTHIAFFAVAPITPLHLVNNLGADEWFMAWFGMAELAAGALVSIVGGKLIERYGSRAVIGCSMLGTSMATLIIALSPNLHLTLAAAAISGASWTLGAVIGLFSYFAENISREEMPHYSGAYHQVIALGVFIGPMLGTALASSGVNLATVLLAGALFRLLAGLAIQYGVPVPHWMPHPRMPHLPRLKA